MPASSHSNQDSYAYGDSESEQWAVFDLAGHPVQSVVAEFGAELGGFAAKAPASSPPRANTSDFQGLQPTSCSAGWR